VHKLAFLEGPSIASKNKKETNPVKTNKVMHGWLSKASVLLAVGISKSEGAV
jgi:hypothetical protein